MLSKILTLATIKNAKLNIRWVENPCKRGKNRNGHAERSRSIDISKWDAIVAKSASLNLYCYSWYLDTVSDNWGALIYGDYEFIMPIPYTIKKGQNIIYQPFFSQQLNVLGQKRPSNDVLNAFIAGIPDKFKLIQFNFPIFLIRNTYGFEIEEVVFQSLDLSQSYEEIQSKYSTNAKRILKKAGKNDLSLTQSDNLDAFIQLFKKTIGERLNFTEDNYTRLQNLMEVGIEKELGKLYLVQQGDEVLAMGYFFIQNNRITYLKGASTESGRKNGTMFYLLDQMIEKYANSNRIFDFGGSKVPSIARFYKKLGGIDEKYLSFSQNNLPWIIKKVKNLRDRLK